jgi:RNA polymerase sigma-70 factor (ECF subfamily)
MSTSDMQDLAARLSRGDEAAFAELYDACAARLHRYLAARLSSHELASDVIQSAFLRVVKSRKRFHGVDNPVAYLFQIARNEAIRLGTRQRVGERPLTAAEFLSVDSSMALQREDADVVAVALQRLAFEDREIVELKVFGGLTFREIADVTGLPSATVATRYRRALESVRPWVEKQLR